MALIKKKKKSIEPRMARAFYGETLAEFWQELETQFANQKSHSQFSMQTTPVWGEEH